MMRISSFRVKNFRSLADVNIPLCNYTILIGRNNAGKSSVLLALKLLFEGTSRDLSENDFYVNGEQRAEDISLEAILEGVSEYLPLCNEKHRSKIADCIVDDTLRIRRLVSRSPLDVGKLELWQPKENDFGLPTGIESALKQLLPELIFIEAFKDPSEEAQTKSSATFGKLLKQIVGQVSSQLEPDIKDAFDRITRLFNVVEMEGTVHDERPKELQRIEQKIKEYMRAIFEEADVRLRFRMPEIDDLFGSAIIELRDRGPWTPLEGKGQGFQRTLYLALLRTLAEELRTVSAKIHRPFLLLFEEPEVFLHPALQREMGDILESISSSNQVIITTHSPLLVTPQRIQNVLILQPITDIGSQATKCLIPNPNSLPNPEDKQLANLLRFSNSAEFLFADHVLVVEGPSDRALLEASWHVLRTSLHSRGSPLTLAIVEAGSKAVVPAWINYLRAFGLSACGVVDLDFLWDGAGRCLKADPRFSQFTNEFWKLAEQKGISGTTDGKRCIPPERKSDAFRLILNEFKEQAQTLRQQLQTTAWIWVLSQGEIERYFNLSSSSKGHYAAVSQRVRNGEVPVDPEIKSIMEWVISIQ